MIRTLRNEGLSISEIARRVGVDRKTVRKALESDRWPEDGMRPRVVRPSKLDPFKPYIKGRLEKVSVSAVRIYEEIAGQGYTGKMSILKEFIHGLKEEARLRAVVRFETMPGEQAQVDWTYMGRLVVDGEAKPVYGFAMVLGYSRMRFVKFTHSMDIPTLMRCHQAAFEYFGGHTRGLLYDNMKTVILRPRGADSPATVNPQFADFAGYYGFGVDSCAAYRAQTKGKVERLAGYVKDNFYLGREFVDLEDMNRQGVEWLDDVNSRVHGTTGKVPREEIVKEGLIPVAGQDYDTSRVATRMVTRDCRISYLGNRYEAPYRLAGRPVTVKDNDDGMIRVYSGTELVVEHRKAKGKGQVVSVPGLNEELWRKVLGRSYAEVRRKPAGGVTDPASLVLVGRTIPVVAVQRRDLSYYEEVAG